VLLSVPVNLLPNCESSKRFWKEGVSFEHQYNSRLDPSYPPRGKVCERDIYSLKAVHSQNQTEATTAFCFGYFSDEPYNADANS